VVTNLVLALIIQVTNRVFMPFATRMTVVENHRTETMFEDNLIAKVFVFQFVNSYGALFYVSMAQGPLARMAGASQPWKMQRFDCALAARGRFSLFRRRSLGARRTPAFFSSNLEQHRRDAADTQARRAACRTWARCWAPSSSCVSSWATSTRL